MSDHTPGPWDWVCSARGSRDLMRLVGEGGATVCYFGNDRTYYPSEGEEPDPGDARLIAAAPDLLAACEQLVAIYDVTADHRLGATDSTVPDYSISAIRAAIAMAKGETK